MDSIGDYDDPYHDAKRVKLMSTLINAIIGYGKPVQQMVISIWEHAWTSYRFKSDNSILNWTLFKPLLSLYPSLSLSMKTMADRIFRAFLMNTHSNSALRHVTYQKIWSFFLLESSKVIATDEVNSSKESDNIRDMIQNETKEISLVHPFLLFLHSISHNYRHQVRDNYSSTRHDHPIYTQTRQYFSHLMAVLSNDVIATRTYEKKHSDLQLLPSSFVSFDSPSPSFDSPSSSRSAQSLSFSHLGVFTDPYVTMEESDGTITSTGNR